DALAYAALSAIGTVIDNDGLTGSAESYFGLIDHNDLRSEVRAWINVTPVVAGGVASVSAVEAATLIAFDDSLVQTWQGLGAVIVTNVVLSSARAWIEGGSVVAGGLDVSAENVSTLEATATSRIEGFDETTGFTVAFNSIGWKSSNILFNGIDALLGDPLISEAFDGSNTPSDAQAWLRDVHVTIVGDVAVSASQAAQLTAIAGNEGVADAALDGVLSSGSATTGLAGGGVLASNKVNTLARAFIEGSGAPVSVSATGDVTVAASDAAAISAHITVVQSANVSNTAEGLAQTISGLVPTDNDYTTRSGTREIQKGDRVRIGPDDGTLGIDGHVYEYIGDDPLTVDLGSAAADYTNTALWTDLSVEPDLADYYPNIGNLTKSDARAIGILIVMNDLRAESEAYVDNAHVTAGGSVSVTAEELTQLLAEATSTVAASGGSFYGTGTVQAINGQIITNVVLSSTTASISDSTISAGADVTVAASSHAGVDATLLAATNSGDLAFSISLAFNSLGWDSQNFLFNLIDTILGDPLIADAALHGEDPALVSATITGSTVDAGGAINVTAVGATLLNATVSNAADSTASALFNATGKALGFVVAQNKVSSQAVATIDDSSVSAGGELTIHATDEAGIWSNIKIVSSSQTTNNGGLPVLQDEINNFLDGAKYFSNEGERPLVLGDKVRIHADQASGGVTKNALYEWMGVDGPVDLTAADYSDLGLWRPVAASTAVPVGLNVTNSDSMGIAAAIVLNDVWSDVVAALRNNAPITAGSVTVEANESATIVATTDVTGSSSGGSSLTGQGQSLAAGGVIATNRVQSSAQAFVENNPIVTTVGDVTVAATNDSLIEATNLVAMQSGAQSIGIALAFNTIGWGRSNLLFNIVDTLLGDPLISSAFGGNLHPSEALASVTNSPITSAGAVSVTAGSTAHIIAVVSNNATSAPAALMGAEGMSANAILASSMVNSRARAIVEGGAVTATGDIDVSASDAAGISSQTTMYSEVAPSNDLGAGILNKWANQSLAEYKYTQQSGTREVKFGDKVRADDENVYQYMGTTATIDLLTQDYTDFGYWKLLTPVNLINDSVSYAVLSALGTVGAAEAYFLLADHNDLRSSVEAHVVNAPLIAGGDVTVSAIESAELTAFDESVVSSWNGYGVFIVTNVMLSSAKAYVENSNISGGRVTVHAENSSTMDAASSTKIEAWEAVSVVAVFNSIGWKSSNLLFNLVDTIIGDPLISSAFNGEQPSAAVAYVRNSNVLAAGDLAVTAAQAAQITATAGNENVVEASVDIAIGSKAQATGLAGGGIVASNKVSTKAQAFIEFTGAQGTIEAAGVLVSAT
ncbi:MAG TPA: hypothetical protein VFD53_02515, partial [Ilumatobacter sp.]|nr:hypothetical protein [Ilumatobacter sp.]